MELNIFIAFLAGLASFLAPCVVPLVPAYISFISGISISELTSSNSPSVYRGKILTNSLLYIFGFSIIFVLMGLGATFISVTLISSRQELLRIGGLFIILFGLYVLGLFNRLSLTQKEFKFSLPKKILRLKHLGPLLLGMTFALAWTPCIGAILGAILTLAATSQTIFEGTFLLFVYSLGISLPFFLIALTIGSSYKLLKKLGPGLHYLNLFSGVLLIIIGFLMMSQRYALLAGYLMGVLNQFSIYHNLQMAF